MKKRKKLTRRKKEFQGHEIQRTEMKNGREKRRKKSREKHLKDAKRVNNPGSRPQLEVWEEEDEFDKDRFNPRTFFKLHEKDNDGQSDPYEAMSSGGHFAKYWGGGEFSTCMPSVSV